MQSMSIIATVYSTHVNIAELERMEVGIGETHLSPNNNRHDNFTTTLRVTGDVTRELKDIRHDDSFLARGRSPAHALSEADLLASRFTVERAQEQQLLFGGGVCS